MSRTAEEIRADLDPANPHRQHWRERLLADVEPLLARVAELEAALANGINEQVEAELLARAEAAEAERDEAREAIGHAVRAYTRGARVGLIFAALETVPVPDA